MSKIECHIVKDLLPNHIDGLNSEETSAEINRHLEECTDCRAVYERLSAEISAEIAKPDQSVAGKTGFLKRLKSIVLRRKFIVAVSTCIVIICLLTVYAISHRPPAVMKGFYQSENINGNYVQISFQPEESSFVAYIDSRKVDSGIYEKSEGSTYIMNGKTRNIEVVLNYDNSFEIIASKLNGGEPIRLKNVSITPAYFPTIFGDEDMYEPLWGS